MRTTFKFLPGDILFLEGRGWFDHLINVFQSAQSADGKASYCHCGVVVSDQRIFETTETRTCFRSLADAYAGSNICVMRWKGMTAERFEDGLAAVIEQDGVMYPYWRLLAHVFKLNGLLHGSRMACNDLSAHFIAGAGMQLKHTNLWKYDVDSLADELASRVDVETVFNGSLRAAGYIID